MEELQIINLEQTDITTWNFVIENNSTYEDLVKNTDLLIDKLQQL